MPQPDTNDGVGLISVKNFRTSLEEVSFMAEKEKDPFRSIGVFPQTTRGSNIQLEPFGLRKSMEDSKNRIGHRSRQAAIRGSLGSQGGDTSLRTYWQSKSSSPEKVPLQLKSVLRRNLYKREKDHLENANVHISSHMSEYFKATGGQGLLSPKNSARLCGLDQATRELEREHLRLQRLAHQSGQIFQYRNEQTKKSDYLKRVFSEYPEMRSVVDPIRDAHVLSLRELKVLVTRHKE